MYARRERDGRIAGMDGLPGGVDGVTGSTQSGDHGM